MILRSNLLLGHVFPCHKDLQSLLASLTVPIPIKLYSNSPGGVVANIVDCNIIVRIQTPVVLLHSLLNLGKGMNSLILSVISSIVPILQEWF